MMGAPGSTAALALLNDAVKKGGIMASSHVGGLSGAFIPVTEDEGMIEAAKCGSLTIEKLEAMTTVCSVGLDMIAIPGIPPAATIAGLSQMKQPWGLQQQDHRRTADTSPREKPGRLGYLWRTLRGRSCDAGQHKKSRSIYRPRGHIPPPIHSFRN
jgi:uncharacterized protein (UPF0210 family)